MRVGLIAPPFSGSSRGLPLGLAYLAATLERHGFETQVLDMTVCGHSDHILSEFLSKAMPDFVGISAVSATYLDAVCIARFCRNVLGPLVPIALGGPHATFCSDTVLKRNDFIDLCIIGEGEETIVETCKVLDSRNLSLNLVEGLVFRDGSSILRNTSRSLLPDLDILPLPARQHFQIGLYPDAIGTFEVGASNKVELIASRGCPFGCEFCSTKELWQKIYRNRSPENVVQELEYLASLGNTDVYFNDDIFTCRRSWVMSLCDLIVDRGLELRWACGTRVDCIDHTLLSRMKAAGCIYVYFGVESGDAIINNTQQKGTNTAEVETAFELLHKLEIYSSAALIFGLPNETFETATKTVKWVRDVLQPDEVWISKAACYPGTPLASRYSVS